ncbi:LysE family translocator [Massilia sp. SM-13]|uniref:LysE family translocator n=1 Tax=Pseudoduganella rhizocola TaxID=3382643 RepID=UPI0038B41D7A
MEYATLLLFVPACFAINMAPGPNNLLSISNATRYGLRAAWLAGAGRLLAFAGMIALASAGLAVVLHTSQLLFTVIKTVGALYLFYIAWQLWRAVPEAEGEVQAGATLWQLARQEFLVAAGNPKAILVFTAFLPQFVDPRQSMALQFTILGALFLLFELVAIGLYAWMGLGMKRFLGQPRGRRLFNRSCATLLGGAGLGLLLSRRV